MPAFIKPSNNNGSIRLRFAYLKHSYQLTNLGSFDDPVALRKAKLLADQISFDIAAGCFDHTLSKYKPIQPDKADSQVINWSVALNDWITHRTRMNDCGKSYLSDLSIFSKKLIVVPKAVVTNPIKLIEWLVQTQSAYMTNKYHGYLNQVANWQLAKDEISSNPFTKLRKLIPKLDEDADINPFSADERDQIIEAFKRNSYYRHYWQLVAFLFFTGCRPCEAVPLVWGNIIDGKITFKESKSQTDHRKRLKTQKQRTVRISPRVNDVLESIERNNTLVFPSPKGTFIDWHNFTNRAWMSVLGSLPIEYRNPYQMRHAFITEAIKSNISSTLIAKHCGTSTEMIERHYLGDVSNVEI